MIEKLHCMLIKTVKFEIGCTHKISKEKCNKIYFHLVVINFYYSSTIQYRILESLQS